MAKNEDSQRVADLFGGKFFKSVLAAGALLSISLFVGSYSTTNELHRIALLEISMIILGAVIVTFFHQIVLGDYFRHKLSGVVEKSLTPILKDVKITLSKDIHKIIPEVTAATVESIDDIRIRVSEASEFMLNGIGVLSGAKSAGIVNIFPTRYEKISGESVIDAITKDIQAESSSIRLMGISLGDYFLDRGVLHRNFIDLVESSSDTELEIQALILHPKCEALRERARWEAGQEYYKGQAFFDSTTFIETDGAARISRRLCQKYENRLAVRLYAQAPTAFVLLTSRFAFIEGYNYAARGSNVPILQVQAGVPLYKFFESHFDRIWGVSEAISEYDPTRSDVD